MLKSCLKEWKFVALEFGGISNGVINGWIHCVSFINAFSISLGLCAKLQVKALAITISMLNFYGQYENRKSYWKNVFSFDILREENVVIRGELNFTLNVTKV
jgi:hypothetical protein